MPLQTDQTLLVAWSSPLQACSALTAMRWACSALMRPLRPLLPITEVEVAFPAAAPAPATCSAPSPRALRASRSAPLPLSWHLRDSAPGARCVEQKRVRAPPAMDTLLDALVGSTVAGLLSPGEAGAALRRAHSAPPVQLLMHCEV